MGVFTHREGVLQGKRPRLELFLACGKVLPEDATNLRIIDGSSYSRSHALRGNVLFRIIALSLGPSPEAPGHLQSGAGFPFGDNPGELPAGLFGLFRSHPFQNRAYCEKVNV